MKSSRYQVVVFASTAVIFFASDAFAGKPERDKAEELKPSVEATAAGIQANCGCPAKITLSVDWDSYAKVEDMRRIPDTLTSLGNATKSQCVKDEDKKVFCEHVSGFQLHYSKENLVETKDKVIILGSNIVAFPGEAHLKKLFGQF